MTLAEEIKNLTWHNAIYKLKSILNKLTLGLFVDAPQDGNQYARQDGEWTEVEQGSGGGVQTVNGEYVNNTDPLNPILDDPRPYKVYTALLTQTGINTPIATILENTTGKTFTYDYIGVGRYNVRFNIVGLSIDNLSKITVNATPCNDDGWGSIFNYEGGKNDQSYIEGNTCYLSISTWNKGNSSEVDLKNDCLYNSFFEIRIYN